MKIEPEPDEIASRFRLAGPLFKELDVSGTHSPLLLVTVPAMAEWSDDEPWPEGCTLFIPFQDPENVGAVIRSAAAFGASRVVLLREAAHPSTPGPAGPRGRALFQVPLLHGPSIRDLSSRQVPIIALDASGPELGEVPFPSTFGLVAGIEGPGLPGRLRTGERRRIAMMPGVESLERGHGHGDRTLRVVAGTGD